MDRFLVRPGPPLSGEIRVSGATKNSGLKQLAAALLAPGTTVLRNMPPVADSAVMIEVMRAIGAVVEWAGPDVPSVGTGGAPAPQAAFQLGSREAAALHRARPRPRRLR